MRKLGDYGGDDHPADDPERPQVAWSVALLDDCDGCDAPRVELTLEEMTRPGTGVSAHLARPPPGTSAARWPRRCATSGRTPAPDPGR